MWEITNTSQSISFLYSIVLGVIYAVLYDFFRAFRKVVKQSFITIFIEDIIYFIILSIITFLSLLSLTNGEIRGYVLFGILLGFLLFLFTLSKYLVIVLTFILNGFFKLLDLISKAFYLIVGKIDNIIVIFSKNTLKCLKKGLKKVIGMLYTNRKSKNVRGIYESQA